VKSITSLEISFWQISPRHIRKREQNAAHHISEQPLSAIRDDPESSRKTSRARKRENLINQKK
jgi:hypothetical protein